MTADLTPDDGALQSKRRFSRRRALLWICLGGVGISALVGIMGLVAGIWVLWRYSTALPSYEELAVYAPPVTSRVHAADGELLAEFARQRRIFLPIEAIPERLQQAFLAAEDKNFYDHRGVDVAGVARAMAQNVMNVVQGRRLVGASTITQQVAKNFLLTSEVSIDRKIKEALLALRIERAYSKKRILELYLNEIYLGVGSYGVAAAAQAYFGVSLDALTLGQMAYLAALPKGPNNYHPLRHPERAKERRDWVLARMAANGWASPEESAQAQAAPFQAQVRARGSRRAAASWFVEEVAREVAARHGGRALLEGGLSIRTSLDTHYQEAARAALRAGLMRYDQSRGWRGATQRLDSLEDWHKDLAAIKRPEDMDPWRLAVVLALGTEGEARIGLRPSAKAPRAKQEGVIPAAGYAWAQAPPIADTEEAATQAIAELEKPEVVPPAVGYLLSPGDVVWVEPRLDEDAAYDLRQVPLVNGSIAALDPHTGRVMALVGGFSFGLSQFSRASQAWRQPGSVIKPFVYAAALEQGGYNPASIILDAPFVSRQGQGGLWKPSNYRDTFYGPSPLRLGLERSRNLMTIRLAQGMGIGRVMEYVGGFNILRKPAPALAMVLGAGETTLLRLLAAYAVFANGGREVAVSLVDREQDRRGRTVFRQDTRECLGCAAPTWRGEAPPALADERAQVMDPRVAYQITSMLEGVVQRGTGYATRIPGRTLAGKTGTTNDSRDAWFIGFTPDLVAGVFVGFDTPVPMGRGATGGSLAAPIFRQFMEQALRSSADRPFATPPGIRFVRVGTTTGRPDGSAQSVLEAFVDGAEPRGEENLRRGSASSGGLEVGRGESALGAGTGGLY